MSNDPQKQAEQPAKDSQQPVREQRRASANGIRMDRDEHLTANPLPPTLARQVEDEAIAQAALSSGGAQEHYRRGRIEAETHRISEEMTRLAQLRLRLAQQLDSTKMDNQHPGDTATAMNATIAGEINKASSAFNGAETLPAPRLLTSLLVPVAGAPQGERLLPYAAALAQLTQARVVLGHVTVDRGSRASLPGFPASPHPVEDLLPPPASAWQKDQQASADLQQLRARLQAQLAPAISRVDTLQVNAPSVIEGLSELETLSEADLVLVNLRPHSALNHLSLGSVIDTMIRKGPLPLLVIPPHAPPAGQAEPAEQAEQAGQVGIEKTPRPTTIAFRHLLVPLDGSALAEAALSPLRGWLGQAARTPDARITVTLLGVAENAAVLPDYQSYLQTLRQVLLRLPEFAGVQVQVEAVVGSAPGAIVGAVEQNLFSGVFRAEPTDVLFMATHGRGGLGRWLFGSVADYVLPRVHVPVVLIHPTFLDL